MTEGVDVMRSARSWLGTPYRHQGARKGVGCDCLGLVRGVWRGNERHSLKVRPAAHTQALRAHKLFNRDQQYIVRDNEVMLIDEFTGRMMRGRRLSDGLHQAIEAKEGVKVQPENVTLASVTFQNYFRLYAKLAGMTGTAQTEAEEFLEIYRLGVVEVPTNRPVQRVDEHDAVYRTAREKNLQNTLKSTSTP